MDQFNLLKFNEPGDDVLQFLIGYQHFWVLIVRLRLAVV